MKPIAEWTDAELRERVDEYRSDLFRALAAEVLRQRAVIEAYRGHCDHEARADQAEAEALGYFKDWSEAMDRAEKAEADAGIWQSVAKDEGRRVEALRAALARVRALCDRDWIGNEPFVFVDEIRAFIDGP